MQTVTHQHQLVDSQFSAHFGAIIHLQRCARDALREMARERNLDEDTILWAEDSIDIPTTFRFLKKHDFSHTPALAALLENSVWRLNTLPQFNTPEPSLLFRFMPSEATDHFSRPILVVRTKHLSGLTTVDLKNQILTTYELARLHIADLYRTRKGKTRDEMKDGAEEEEEEERVLQFVVVIDLNGLAIRDVPMDVVSWFGHVVIPNYPGLCAAAYCINYSWTYSGVWNVLKRVLPERALQRVFFPSAAQLLLHLPRTSLSKEHGGILPSPRPDYDPLLRRYLPDLDFDEVASQLSKSSPTSSPQTTSSSTLADSSASSSSTLTSTTGTALPTSISPRSILNPFFGYAVHFPSITSSSTTATASFSSLSESQIPQLTYGRRRKRDLARTLFILFIERIVCGVKNVFSGRRGRRRRRGEWMLWLVWIVFGLVVFMRQRGIPSLSLGALRARIRAGGGNGARTILGF